MRSMREMLPDGWVQNYSIFGALVVVVVVVVAVVVLVVVVVIVV